MILRRIIRKSYFTIQQQCALHQKSAAKIASEKCELENIRNIGILAHIDAGLYTYIFYFISINLFYF